HQRSGRGARTKARRVGQRGDQGIQRHDRNRLEPRRALPTYCTRALLDDLPWRRATIGAGAVRLRQVQMAARQGARDADRHRSAEGRLGQSNKLAAAVCNHRVARAACRRQASAGAGAHAKIQRELRRIYSSVGAGKNRHLQDHLVIGGLDRRRAGRAARAIAHLDRRQGLRRRAQERQVRTRRCAFHRAAQQRRSEQRRARDQQRVICFPSPRAWVGGKPSMRRSYCLSVLATLKLASVLPLLSSSVTSGASSIKVSPPPFRTSVNTPRSVITISTTPAPVSGSEQRRLSFDSSLVKCSITTMTFFTPPTRSIAPPMPLTILPGIIQLARSPFSATCMAPRMAISIWPPRIMAKESAELK